jgi:hypothetical protein
VSGDLVAGDASDPGLAVGPCQDSRKGLIAPTAQPGQEPSTPGPALHHPSSVNLVIPADQAERLSARNPWYAGLEDVSLNGGNMRVQ